MSRKRKQHQKLYVLLFRGIINIKILDLNNINWEEKSHKNIFIYYFDYVQRIA